MVVNSMNSQSSEHTNNFWLSDNGCNVHMTNELVNLNLSNNYNGEETVTVGNGQSLNIQNTSSGNLSTSSHTFNLSKILHAPQLAANLLSIHKFCLDNNCIFIFYVDWFLIQDKVTGRTLYTGGSISGLYPIPSISALPTSTMHSTILNFHAKQEHSSLWHFRLGHPASRILSSILSHIGLSSSHSLSTYNCTSCLKAKILKKIPFPIYLFTSLTPLALVHSDVWGPSPIISSNGNRYYVSFIDKFSKFTWLFPIGL
ncbi:hypothetical protein IC575_004375 [Cucumis melo]